MCVRDLILRRLRWPCVTFWTSRCQKNPDHSCNCYLFFFVCRPHTAQWLWTFLQVGHSGLQSNQGFTFHILLESLLWSVSLTSFPVLAVFHGAHVFVDVKEKFSFIDFDMFDNKISKSFGGWMLFLRYLCIVYKLICYALAKHTTFYLTTLCQMAQPVYYTIFLFILDVSTKFLHFWSINNILLYFAPIKKYFSPLFKDDFNLSSILCVVCFVNLYYKPSCSQSEG